MDTARGFRGLTGAATAALLVYVIGQGVDARVLADGAGVWVKPTKFAASFVVMFATMAWVAARSSDTVRSGAAMVAVCVLMAVNFAGEMTYITLQAAQAEESHFNTATAYHLMMYRLMGLSAVLLIAGVAWQGMIVWRDRGTTLAAQTQAGVVWGFGATFVLTFVVAGYLGNNGSHFVGIPGPDARVLPLFGWSADVGDLRPPHFLSIHAMQALPLVGFGLDRAGLGGRAWLPLATVAYAALTLALFAQALMGWPLIRLS